jgi:hypothetical protein
MRLGFGIRRLLLSPSSERRSEPRFWRISGPGPRCGPALLPQRRGYRAGRLLGDSGRSGSWRSASPGTGDRHDRGVANPIVSSEAMRNANAIVALSS